MSNAISRISEIASKRRLDPPKFETISETGPSHCPRFTVEAKFADLSARGDASSKKEARHKAANLLLEKIQAIPITSPESTPSAFNADRIDFPTIPSLPVDQRTPKSRLAEIAARQGWVLLTPAVSCAAAASAGSGGFEAEVLLFDDRLIARGRGISKSEAEHAAAALALAALGPEPPLPCEAYDASLAAGRALAERVEWLCLAAFERARPLGFARRTVVAGVVLQVLLTPA